MAQNNLPRQPGGLLVLAGKCEAGLTTYAVPLDITQITAASLAADAGTLSAAMTGFNATRANRTAAHAALETASDAAKTFIAHGKGVLAAHWGNDYSQQWAAAGWTDHSTAIPNTQPGRLALAPALDGFLTANANFAVDAPLIVNGGNLRDCGQPGRRERAQRDDQRGRGVVGSQPRRASVGKATRR